MVFVPRSFAVNGKTIHVSIDLPLSHALELRSHMSFESCVVILCEYYVIVPLPSIAAMPPTAAKAFSTKDRLAGDISSPS